MVFDRYLRGETIAPLMRELPCPDDAFPGRYYPEGTAQMRFLEKWG